MKKILIIGGGFGGVRTALDLDKKFSAREAEITLIDKNNFHLFLPALYEAGTAIRKWNDQYQVELRKAVNIPYADIFEGTNVKFAQAEIVGIDLEKKEAVSGGGGIWAFDYLVLGLGAETETFGITGVADYAYKFKGVDEALFLNKKINEVFKEIREGKLSGPIKFIVAGGGFNGVELAAEISCCAKNLQGICGIKEDCYGVKIIEMAPWILPMISEKERMVVRKRLADLKVEILENSKIAEVGLDFVQIEGGEKHQADFIIWTAGIRASSFLKNIFGLRLDERGKIIVNDFMQADGWPNIFALGDNTIFIDRETKKPVPALAYVAVDQGKIAAENIYRMVKNKHLKSYRPFYNVWIAPVGGKFAVAHLTKNITISGFWGWVVRGVVDFRYFLSILPLSKAISLLTEEIEVFTKND